MTPEENYKQLKKHLPYTEFRMRADVGAPLQIIDEGKLKGLLMPIRDTILEDVVLASKSKELQILAKPSQKLSPQKRQDGF